MGVHNSVETLDKFKEALKTLSTNLHAECDKVNGTINQIENEVLNTGNKLRKQIQECEGTVKHAQVVYNTCVLVKGERDCRSEEEQLIRAIKQLRTAQERQKVFEKLCQQFTLAIENWKKACSNHELFGNQEKIIGIIDEKQELLRRYIQGSITISVLSNPYITDLDNFNPFNTVRINGMLTQAPIGEVDREDSKMKESQNERSKSEDMYLRLKGSNANNIKISLEDYGISKEHVKGLKERKMKRADIHFMFYDRDEGKAEEEFKVIPVNKIVGVQRLTERITETSPSFWNAIQDKNSNVNLFRLQSQIDFINKKGLQEYHKWLASKENVERPGSFSSVHYFQDDDVYIIGEGNHRATMAILTGAQEICIRKTVYYKLNHDREEKERKAYKRKLKSFLSTKSLDKLNRVRLKYGHMSLDAFHKATFLNEKFSSKNKEDTLKERGVSNTTMSGSAYDHVYTDTRPLDDVFPELKGVNPHYVEGAGPGVNTNCVSCANAAHARITGRDPFAVAEPSKGYGTENDLLPSAPWGFYDASLNDIKKVMSEAGDGAAGVVILKQGSIQHVINVVNKGRDIYFVDTQIGKIVDLNPNLNLKIGVP